MKQLLSLYTFLAVLTLSAQTVFYAEKNGIYFPGEEIAVVTEMKGPMEITIHPFGGKVILRKKVNSAGGRIVLEAPDKFGYYIVNAWQNGKEFAQCAFGIIPRNQKQDPFFGINHSTCDARLYDTYARIGVGTIEFGLSFYFFRYDPNESFEQYRERVAAYPMVRSTLQEIAKGKFQIVGRLSGEFPLRGNSPVGENSQVYFKDAVARIEEQNKYPYRDVYYRHMQDHALALYDLAGGKIKRWIIMDEIDCRVLSQIDIKTSRLKTMELANEVLATRNFYHALTSRDPKIELAALGLSGADYFSNEPRFSLSRILLHDMSKYCTALSIDAYTGNYGPIGELTPPESGGLRRFLLDYQSLSKEFGKDGTIYQAERGYHEYHDVPLESELAEQYANYAARSLIIGKSVPGVAYYSIYNSTRGAWHRYYSLIKNKEKFVDGTCWIVAPKENSNDRYSSWTHIPRYEAVVTATVIHQLTDATPFRMNYLELPFKTHAALFRKAGKILCAIWTEGQPVKMNFQSKKLIPHTALTGCTRQLAPGKIELNITGAPQFLSFDEKARTVRTLLKEAVFSSGSRYQAGFFRLAPDRVLIHLQDNADGSKRVYEQKIAVDAKTLTVGQSVFPLPQYNLIGIPQEKMAQVFKLTSPDNVWPRERIVRESSDVLKYDGKDIDAEVSMGWTPEQLCILAKVRDRAHIQRYLGKDLWKDDNMQFAIFSDLKKAAFGSLKGYVYNASAALTSSGPQYYRYHSSSGADKYASVRRDGLYTIYELAIPWSELGITSPQKGQILAMNFVFFDNNDPAYKMARHWLALAPGLAGGSDPFSFQLFQLK